MENKSGTEIKGGFFYRMLCGFFLGVSVMAPGVSGSIMAVMMGIYGDLIDIISNPFKNFKKNFVYLLPMGIGAVLSLLILVRLLDFLFDRYPLPSYLLFIGLIGGSVPAVFGEANRGPFKKRYIAAAAGAFAFALTVALSAKSGAAVTADPGGIFRLSLCGSVAGVTSMVPGMSVSMVLMMLGVYETLLEAAKNFDFLTVIPVTACFAAGMVLFSRFTKFIFGRYRQLAYFMVLGFMCGSLTGIFPGLPQDAQGWVTGIASVSAGLLISSLFRKLGKSFGAQKSEIL